MNSISGLLRPLGTVIIRWELRFIISALGRRMGGFAIFPSLGLIRLSTFLSFVTSISGSICLMNIPNSTPILWNLFSLISVIGSSPESALLSKSF
jgi:hypothetical protein